MKWFCCSDIHGFYDELIQALTDAGFESTNQDHGIIVCGDIFDRGKQPLKVYEFLKSLPKERRILIRGNHEFLLRDLVKRGYALSHDVHNGTEDTLCYIANIITDSEYNQKQIIELTKNKNIDELLRTDTNYDKLEKRRRKKYNNRKIKEILKWIASDEWINYYETNNYIFVHSFIPLRPRQNLKFSELFSTPNEYDPDWRNVPQFIWEEATWGCPWQLYLNYFEPEIRNGKILVCGHWHASDFWNHLDFKDTPELQLDTAGENPLYKSEKYPNIIGLDACTVRSHRINVLVLDDEDM